MAKQLEILDELVAGGNETFESRDVQRLGGLSSQSASNLLSRLVDQGFVDRVARGRYAVRPLGALGTRAASEDVALAVAAAFGSRPHRISYRSALDFHGLLEHPAREIVISLTKATSSEQISGRRLRSVIEAPNRINLGAIPAGFGACVSTVERALVESAARPELAGGASTLASALAAATFDPNALVQIAHRLGKRVALQRIGSIAEALDLSELARRLEPNVYRLKWTSLDPQLDELQWSDDTWRVSWPYAIKELEETVKR